MELDDSNHFRIFLNRKAQSIFKGSWYCKPCFVLASYLKKKKKQNESLQNKYHQEACRKQPQPCWESDSGTGSCCSLLQNQLQAGLLLQATTGLTPGIQQDLCKGSKTRGENPTATAEDIAYALNAERRTLQGPLVNMCIAAGPSLSMRPGMTLSPL